MCWNHKAVGPDLPRELCSLQRTEAENARGRGASAFAFALLFYSSCARSGRAMGSSTNINRSTWWGESSALHMGFPGGSAGAVHSGARGLRRMRSSLGEKEFSVGLETQRCIPPSAKVCRNVFLMDFVCLWQELWLFGENEVLFKED